MKEAENRAPCGKRAAAHGSGPEQEIKRTSPGNRRFAKQNEKRKRKKESLAHIRKISVNYFARKSLRSFLPFFSSRSLERRGEYLGYLGRWNRIDSKLENLASLETAKMLLSLVSRWIRVAPGGRVHTHTRTHTHTYI